MSLTPSGGGALVLAASAVASAFLLQSVAAAAFGVGLLLAVAIAYRTPRPRVTATRLLEEGPHREGQPIAVRVQVEAGAAVHVRDGIPGSLRVAEGSAEGVGRRVLLSYVADPIAPGRTKFTPLIAEVGDALGLVRHVVEIDAPGSVLVLPRNEDVPAPDERSRRFVPTPGRNLVGQAGGGSEFFALREYQPGDTMRQVNWRASARTGGRLVVNQREMESQGSVTYFVDRRAVSALGTWRENGWADAVRATAALAYRDARSRDRPVVILYGATPTVLAPAAGDASLASLLPPMCEAGPDGDAPAVSAVAAELGRVKPRSVAVFVTHGLRDPSLPEAVAALVALDVRVAVVLLDAPHYLRLSGARAERIERARADRIGLAQALRARGARVLERDSTTPLAIDILRGVAS